MTDISDWIDLTDLITSFLAYFGAKKANRTAEAVTALGEVVEVAEKTQVYVQHRIEGGGRNREVEFDLVERWSHAAHLISSMNKDLSNRLTTKSRIWRSPLTWLANVNISLDILTADARHLLDAYA